MLTAGHCVGDTNHPKEGFFYEWASGDPGMGANMYYEEAMEHIHHIGTVTQWSFPGHDWARIDATGSEYWDRQAWPARVVLWGEYNYNQVVQENYEIEGEDESYLFQTVCHSGLNTGTSCGTVTGTDMTLSYGEGDWLKHLTLVTGGCVAGGDSGGSVFANHMALGILSGGTTGDEHPCWERQWVYTNIKEATAALDVRIAPNFNSQTSLAATVNQCPQEWVSLSGNVSGEGKPNGTVNIGLSRFEGGQWIPKHTLQATIGNGSYQVSTAGLRGGKWRAKAVYPGAAVVNGSESGYFEFFVSHPPKEDDGTPGPRVLFRCNDEADVFYRQTNGNLGHRWFSPSTGWVSESLTASMASDPRFSYRPNGELDVFYRQTSGNLGHHWFSPSTGWVGESLSASIASDPKVSYRPNGEIDVFYRQANGNLGHHWFSPSTGWVGESLSASMASDPQVSYRPNGEIDVFYRQTNGDLGHHWWNPNTGWVSESLAASMTGNPRASYRQNGEVDVFYRQANGNLGHRWWNPNTGWVSESLSASMASDPWVGYRPNGELDVFYRQSNGNLGHRWYSASSGWVAESLSASMVSDPQVSYRSYGDIDVFYRQTNGNLGHRWFSPSTGWVSESLTASMASDPEVSYRSNDEIDVFYRQTSGNLGHRWFSPSAGWVSESLTASMTSDPRVSYRSNGELDVFYRQSSGNLGHRWFSPSAGWVSESLAASIAPRPPAVLTGNASAVAITAATLSGTVHPERTPSSYYFEYGPTTSYGSKMPLAAQEIGNGGESISVSQSLTGLSAGTTYYYRLVASSSEGTTYGAEKSFKTATVAERLAAMPITEPFDGSTESKSNFSTKWSVLGWAAGKGESTSTGWRSLAAYPALNGAYLNAAPIDAGEGLATVVKMAAEPTVAERHFSLWLDIPYQSSASQSGYELRLASVGPLMPGAYAARIYRWQGGSMTSLANGLVALPVNGSIALVDQGATVSAWANTGSGFTKLFSPSDSTFAGGKAGIQAGDEAPRLRDFRAGGL